MKVVAINGSAKPNGNTAQALAAAREVLEKQGVQTEQINLGAVKLHGCTGCGTCHREKNRLCVFTDDKANDWFEPLFTADGILLGSPVYFAGISGALKSFLDRAFFVSAANGGLFRHKVGAAIVAVRRAGSLPAIEQLHKYFTIAEMFVPSSNYWNMVFGLTPGESEQDKEGQQCVQVLAANMAWLMKVMEHGKKSIPPPARVEKTMMHFIR